MDVPADAVRVPSGSAVKLFRAESEIIAAIDKAGFAVDRELRGKIAGLMVCLLNRV